MQKGFIRCLVTGCYERAVIIFPRNPKKLSVNTRGYCRKHYGSGGWIRKQKLFQNNPYDLEKKVELRK